MMKSQKHDINNTF